MPRRTLLVQEESIRNRMAAIKEGETERWKLTFCEDNGLKQEARAILSQLAGRIPDVPFVIEYREAFDAIGQTGWPSETWEIVVQVPHTK